MRFLMNRATCPNDMLPMLLYLFGDVHALLTSEAKLKRFQLLPYSAIKVWAGSDDLVVDSENSVAIALGCWTAAGVKGAHRELTNEQKEELSGLLRVTQLTAGTSWMLLFFKSHTRRPCQYA
jgi:hypothetical protein